MKDLIIAMDFPSKSASDNFLKNFKNESLFLKIGMELFYKEGPSIVKEYKKMGHKIFLDLKLHDIPNSVKGATDSLLNLDVDMINFHAAGGIKMMKLASDLIRERKKDTITLGVTMLTSTDEETMHRELLIDNNLPLSQVVLSYATLAQKAGLNGVVCSALEVEMIKKKIGNEFITVTPGIRPKGFESDDQKRIVSPKDARKLGSDYIVVGRPITKASNPLTAYKNIKNEFLGE